MQAVPPSGVVLLLDKIYNVFFFTPVNRVDKIDDVRPFLE